MVSGWRKERIDNFVMRRIPSRCANWLMAKLSGVDIHDFGTTFKAYRREVIQNIPLYGEMHRFIPALASWYGASICEIPIKNVNRERGKSHYGIGRTFRVFFDLLTIRFLLKYMSRPLHFFGSFGALGILAGSFISALLLGMKIVNPHQNVMDQHGPLFVIAGVLILAGIQMLAIGLLGELQVRHYYTVAAARALRDRPHRAAARAGRAEHPVGSAGRQILKAGNREQGIRKQEPRLAYRYAGLLIWFRCTANGGSTHRSGEIRESGTAARSLVPWSLIPSPSVPCSHPGVRVHSCACMKAIQIQNTGGPEVLQLAELPIPEPGPGQVLIRVEAIGVNFIEIYFRKGTYKATLPLTPGSEAAGTVEELGPGRDGIQAGDAVASVGVLGSYAEYALVPASQLVKVPDGLTPGAGCGGDAAGNDGALSGDSTYPLEGRRHGAGACRRGRRGIAADADGVADRRARDHDRLDEGEGGAVARGRRVRSDSLHRAGF